MIKLRSGCFLSYKGLECKLLSSTTLKILSPDKRSLNLGFKQYPNNPIYFKHVKESEVSSAFCVITRAKYQSHIFQLTENRLVSNGEEIAIFLNNLDFEAYDKFGFNYRNDNANISVKVGDLEEIWEEREPLLDFSFEVDRVYYLKQHT